MAEARNDTLIGPICEGKSARFDGQACQYCDKRQCRLLRDHRMEEFWKDCRAAWDIFYTRVRVCLEELQTSYSVAIVDEGEAFDFQGVSERLKNQHVNTPNLAAWSAIVKTTVYREISRRFQYDGRIPEKRQCGTCKHVPESPPYFCTKKEEIRKKTAPPCEEYSPVIPDFIPIHAPLAPQDDKDNPSNARLQLEIYNAAQTARNEFSATPESILIEKERLQESPLFTMHELLRQRINQQKPGSKRRQIYARQYEILIMLQQLMCEKKMSEKAAKKAVLEAFVFDGKRINEKQLERDLAKIRDFLKGKMSYLA